MWLLSRETVLSHTPSPNTQISPGNILKVHTKESSTQTHTHTYSHTTKYLNTLKGLSLRLCVVNRALCKLQMVNEAGSEDRREEG